MSSRVPPKAPEPIINEVTHHSITLDWKEYIDRLKEVFNTVQDGRTHSELQQFVMANDEWETIYSGYDGSSTARNLDANTQYQFRLRFKNKNGQGSFSEVLKVNTEKQPLTGEHIHKAIRVENKTELINILEKGEANIEAQDNLDFTPLMAASQKGLAEFVTILLDWNAEVDNKNKSGKTALMLAAFRGQWECAQLLMDAGADLSARDTAGLGVLHYAVDGEQKDIVRKLILAGVDVNMKDNTLLWTPLIRCAGLKNNGNVSVAHELVKGDAEIDGKDRDGKTALHNAIINNHDKLVAYLLEKGASLELKTEMGHNAIELAESLNNRQVKAVLEEFAEKQNST